ncbi:MAG: DUF2752 domain-containing protein [Actinomycetes bacterium]
MTGPMPSLALPAGTGQRAERLDRVRAVAVRVAAVAAGALVLAAVSLPWRPPTLCLLRAATGVPCPFCGGTTAAVELGSGRPLGALAASPLAVFGGAAWVLWPLLSAHAAQWRQRIGARGTLVVGGAVLAAAEAWQLVRLL